MMDEETVEIVVGTYEQLTMGYKIQIQSTLNEEGSPAPPAQQTFGSRAHSALVHCVGLSQSGVAASGSADETIHIFDLREALDLGMLAKHSGSVTCLVFFEKDRLLSASEDGKMILWDTDSWSVVRTLIGHRAGVCHASVHPSGKLALSVGRDRTVRVWDLASGKNAYTVNTNNVAEKVMWNKSSSLYAVVYQQSIEISDAETCAVQATFKSESRINAVAFLTDNVICVGNQCKDVQVFDVGKKEIVCSFEAHNSRVKCLQCLRDGGGENTFLVSAGSDGIVKIWRICDPSFVGELVSETRTDCRITCLAAAMITSQQAKLLTPKAEKTGQKRIAMVHRDVGEEWSLSKEMSEETRVVRKKLKEKPRKAGLEKRRPGKRKSFEKGENVESRNVRRKSKKPVKRIGKSSSAGKKDGKRRKLKVEKNSAKGGAKKKGRKV